MFKSYMIYDFFLMGWVKPAQLDVDEITKESQEAGTWPSEESAIAWITGMKNNENHRYSIIPIWVKH
jgi:hypothetical protein